MAVKRDKNGKIYQSKIDWQNEHTKKITIMLNKNTDKDIIDYIESDKQKGVSLQGIFKQAIRKLIKE